MVGLSDIPCVGKVVDRISDATVAATFRGLQYIFCYKALVNDLNSDIEKLNIEKVRVSRKATAERDNGKTIENHVLKWQKEVDEIQETAKDFSPSWRCIQCLPIPNPVSRFRLGREAVQKAKTVTKLTDSGKELLEIAYLPPVENGPRTDNAFQNFQSRKVAYGKLWEALVTEGSPLIHGIYGMPGVGKTRMMEQIWEEAREKGIFDKVTRAVVSSEKLDVIKLQNDIAGYLNCHFESKDNVDSRASQLKNSLMNGGKVLVILDDVWREIPLDIIGISFGDGSNSLNCKILLTSREEDVCLRNNCKHPVKITILTVVEAWDLFRNTVGHGKIDSLQDETLAKAVCNKCAGLPLVIHAVGKALKFMSYNLWKDALEQLENCKIESVPGIGPEVYACLKLSFENLVEDAKACLLLCSLFPEDADIHIMALIQLSTGSQLVHGGRSRVRAMVDILKSSLLLLESKTDEGKNGEHFKLHDIIRDVARSIAVRDPKYSFSFARCGSRMPVDNTDYGTRKLLHLDLEKNDFHFHDDLVCPGLHTLSLRSMIEPEKYSKMEKFSGGFMSMFVNLRFLVLMDFYWQLQLSPQPLGKLRTLFLYHCDLTYIGKTDVNFFPEKLETLCIRDCLLPSPLDLPNLKYLRKLEIQGFTSDSSTEVLVMVPNAISSLSSLEELHIPNGFDILDGAKKIFILDEISKLTRLTSLQIFLDFDEPFQDTKIFCNLLEFNICVGVPRDFFPDIRASPVSLTRLIELFGDDLEVFESLIERAEEVKLQCTDINVSNIFKRNREAFADLRNLYIGGCDTWEHLARISQDEIQHSRQPWKSFSKLTILEIRDCSSMKYLFCNSVAKCVVQLQELRIFDCPVMEAIIMNEGTSDGEIIIFSKLKLLELSDIPRLKSFYKEKKDMHSSSTSIMGNSVIPVIQFQPLFDGMVAFPSMEELDIKDLEDISDIWGDYHDHNNNVSSFCKLKSLQVSKCNKLETVIPLAMLHKLQNLEHLEIWNCDGLRNLFVPSIARDLIHLKKMVVYRCPMMREIIGAGEQIITDSIMFPELTFLQLGFLQNLTSFWCYQSDEANTYKVKFPSLVESELTCCGKINLEAIELGKDDSTCQLKSLYISSSNQIQLPCTWQLHLYNLETLTLSTCWWHELKSPCFQRLKALTVQNSECSTLFTFSAFVSLQQLQKLKVLSCASLVEIVDDASGNESFCIDKKTITLSQLKYVTLRDLPNLKNFIHNAKYECHMPALKEVEVDNCGLSTLFTCSVFIKLQQLKDIKVSNCRSLEGIVEDARGNEVSDTNDKIITLFRLSSISLTYLPVLKSFSRTVIYAFNMPKLGYFRLHGCPQIENFTSLKTSTPLVSVYSECGGKFPDLNDFIRQKRRIESNLSDCDGESSYSNQELEIESEIVEEE